MKPKSEAARIVSAMMRDEMISKGLAREKAENIINKCEEKGETKVRYDLAAGVYGQQKIPVVQFWLNEIEKLKSDATDVREENRRDQEVSNARRALWISAIAILVALAAFVKSFWG